jgi:hypothetical protein
MQKSVSVHRCITTTSAGGWMPGGGRASGVDALVPTSCPLGPNLIRQTIGVGSVTTAEGFGGGGAAC